MTVLSEQYLLGGKTAQAIYQEIKDLPVADIHTHVDLRGVLDNALGRDPWTALCAGDHYISSAIETLGAMDRDVYYNPATDPFDKWQAYAQVHPQLIGNHIRDWMRMILTELGIERSLNPDTARPIWDELTETLRSERWRPVSIFQNSNMRMMSTTNNPTDSLDEHVEAEALFGKGYWRPTWRPDFLMNLLPSPMGKKTWLDWVRELERVTHTSLVGDWPAFLTALADRHDYFASRGCRASDYGVQTLHAHDVSEEIAAAIFNSACLGESVSEAEAGHFQSFLLRFSMDLDFQKGWLSQIHFGVARNLRRVAFDHGGLDSGCDTINGSPNMVPVLHDLLNHLDRARRPHHRVILYTSSKGDWDRAAGLSRVFPSVYIGTAWWYYDSVSGMLEFFRKIPDIGAGFRKMGPFVTDARNIYSLQPRTDVYRRCLSTALAELVDFRNEPLDEAIALARYLCFEHAMKMIE